jgi:hypothetical protein
MVGEGLGDGEGSAEADDGGATGLRVVLGGGAGCAAAAGWPAPRVSVSPRASPATASTAARTATPDRKLIASKRAFIARRIRSDQPLPSLTT